MMENTHRDSLCVGLQEGGSLDHPRRQVEKMKKQTLILLSSAALTLASAAPSLADGPVDSMKSFAGASTAFFIDVPEGVLLDAGYRVPKKCWHTLAVHLGDEHGLAQNLVGIGLGIPVGMVWGVPYGALHGAKHGIGTGWDKPFTTESFVVSEEK